MLTQSLAHYSPPFIKILATACVPGPVLSPKIQSLLLKEGTVGVDIGKISHQDHTMIKVSNNLEGVR